MGAVENGVRLTAPNLPAVAARGASVPGYDRARVVPRILHLGVGGFHRGHMALYTDETLERGTDWGICGVGLLPEDERMARTLAEQDYLYTVIERDGDRVDLKVPGSIVDFAFAGDDAEVFTRRLADPRVEILSMTITEGGYGIAGGNQTIAAIVAGIESRLAVTSSAPLTILSCDNLTGNGNTARAAILAIAEAQSSELAERVEAACTFPNSMVERITPQTTDADRDWLRRRGIDDGWPVVCESFRQWVIEDSFAAGRPPWEDVGVVFSDRVHDWELYKLRMLNAGHSCIAYLMALAGVVYVDEALALAPVRRYLERLLETEAIPTLAPIPGYPADEYARTVLHRFGNTGIRDQIARLCIDGTSKFPNVLLPTIEAQIPDGPLDCAALALAGWARYLAVVPQERRAPDAQVQRVAPHAALALSDPVAFLDADIFSDRIRTSDRFRAAFEAAGRRVADSGPLAAIEQTLLG